MDLTFLSSPFLGQALWLWLAFFAVVVTLLALDLGVLHRDDHVIGVRESLLLSAATSPSRCCSARASGGSSAARAAWSTSPGS
jgi:hypothetical protein